MKSLKIIIFIITIFFINSIFSAAINSPINSPREALVPNGSGNSKPLTFSQELLSAARANDLIAVKDILKNPAIDVNSKNLDTDSTALAYAANNNYIPLASFLLLNNADINMPNRYGETPLTLAVRNGFADMVDLLLDAGAEPNTENIEGKTPLMLAAENDDVKTIFNLLNYGASIDFRSKKIGHPALISAIIDAKENAVRALLSKGASYKDKHFDASLVVRSKIATSNPDRKIIYEAIKKIIDEHIGVQNTNSAILLRAAEFNDMDRIREILEGSQTNINSQNQDGWTALMFAAFTNNIPLAQYLISRKALVNKKNKSGDTALIIAARQGHTIMTNLLLEEGSADPNIVNKRGLSALMYAAIDDFPEVIQSLISHGAKINDVDPDGYTALIHAIKLRKREAALALVTAEADIISSKGINAFDVIKERLKEKTLTQEQKEAYKDLEDMLSAFKKVRRYSAKDRLLGNY